MNYLLNHLWQDIIWQDKFGKLLCREHPTQLNFKQHALCSYILFLLLLQACGLLNQVANDLGTLTERQI